MGKEWTAEARRDPYYRMAKQSGYRARSAYKLKEMNKLFSLFRQGDRVLDVGAAPGGWSQVALEIVGPTGLVVGVDLQGMEPLPGAIFVKGDVSDAAVVEKLKGLIHPADCVISDISPDLSGNYSMDQARSIYLSTMALEAASALLRSGGNFLTKAFEGEDLEELLEAVRGRFHALKRFHPKASRSASSEIYIIGKGFRGRRRIR